MSDLFRPVRRSRSLTDGRVIKPQFINSFQLMYSKFEYDGELNPTFVPGEFSLEIGGIKAYANETRAAEFVLLLRDSDSKEVLELFKSKILTRCRSFAIY